MGNWDLIRKDLIELSTIKGKDPTMGNWDLIRKDLIELSTIKGKDPAI